MNQANLELSRILKRGGRFLIITANSNCYKDWTESYDDVKNDGIKTVGMKLNNGTLEVADVLFLRPVDEIKISLAKLGLKVTRTESIRIWTLLEGVKE